MTRRTEGSAARRREANSEEASPPQKTSGGEAWESACSSRRKREEERGDGLEDGDAVAQDAEKGGRVAVGVGRSEDERSADEERSPALPRRRRQAQRVFCNTRSSAVMEKAERNQAMWLARARWEMTVPLGWPDAA